MTSNAENPGTRSSRPLARRFHVRCELHHEMDLYHLGRVLTALVDLHAAGEIDLEFVSRTGDSSKSELSVVLHVTNSETRESRGIVIEVADRADRFDERALAGCDVYYKRSFHRPSQEALAPPLRARLRPFGLNYSARGAGAARIGTKVLLRRLVKLLAHPVRALRVLR